MKKLIFYLFAGLLFSACGENEDSDKGIQESSPGSQTWISIFPGIRMKKGSL